MKTFNINDRVMYLSKKIYKIANIEEKDLGSGVKKYYVLAGDNSGKDVLYLPIDNELALKNIRPLLSKEEIEEAIIFASQNVIPWSNAYKDRITLYNALLKENDMKKILCAVKIIIQKKKEFETNKKSLPNVDMTFLNNSLAVINEEFSYVLKINEAEVLEYIFGVVN